MYERSLTLLPQVVATSRLESAAILGIYSVHPTFEKINRLKIQPTSHHTFENTRDKTDKRKPKPGRQSPDRIKGKNNNSPNNGHRYQKQKEIDTSRGKQSNCSSGRPSLEYRILS
ncbi:hypothetical protein RF11_13714 [Thelohanellus kitauei]|uniref:Uncharacterized protein n=1 Tax=Thelohanellus kitauei TaxID=669202 RepID=A0A0C2ICI9_THEKT|nr:hypothetical protein RF11_13714 [Thelohanellus kitauei]